MPTTATAPAQDELLHAMAISGNAWDAVRSTVENGADMRSPLAEPTAEIALVYGRADVVEAMFDRGLAPSASLMTAAAHSGRIESIQSMLDHGCPIDAEHGTPPVVAAATRGHREAVDLLIGLGADLGTSPSAADVASQGGHGELAVDLLRRGCTPWTRAEHHPDDWVPSFIDKGPSERLIKLLDQAADAEIDGVRPREPGHVAWLLAMSMPTDREDRPAWLDAEPEALYRHAAACDVAVQRLVGEKGWTDSTMRLLGTLAAGQEIMCARAAATELARSPNRDAIQAAADRTHADQQYALGEVLGRGAPAPTAERQADQEQQQAPSAPRRDR